MHLFVLSKPAIYQNLDFLSSFLKEKFHFLWYFKNSTVITYKSHISLKGVGSKPKPKPKPKPKIYIFYILMYLFSIFLLLSDPFYRIDFFFKIGPFARKGKTIFPTILSQNKVTVLLEHFFAENNQCTCCCLISYS